MPVYWSPDTTSFPRATAFSPPPHPGITVCWFVPFAFQANTQVMVNVNRNGDGTARGGTLGGAFYNQYSERMTNWKIATGKGTFAKSSFAPEAVVGYKQSDHSAVYSNLYFSSPIAPKTGYIQTPAWRYDTAGAQFSSGWMHIDDLWAPVKGVPVTFDWELQQIVPDGHGGLMAQGTGRGQDGATIDPATGFGSYFDRDDNPLIGSAMYLYVLRRTSAGYGVIVIILQASSSYTIPPDGYTVDPTASPVIKHAISLPTGGGSPRLHAAMARAYGETTGQTVTTGTSEGEFPTATIETTYKWSQSAVRMATSNDFGETFEPGVDLEVSAMDGTAITDDLTGTDTQSDVLWTDPLTGLFSLNRREYSTPWPYRYARPVSFTVAPDGSLYLNGAIGPTPDGSKYPGTDFSQWQWAAARRTSDTTGQSGWRDATTPNLSPVNNPDTDHLVLSVDGRNVCWYGRGNHQGSRGAGGNSRGSSALMMANGSVIFSHDGGDTWEAQTGMLLGTGPSSSVVHHLRGISYDGSFGVRDFLGTSGDHTAVPGLPTAGHSSVLCGTEDTTIRIALTTQNSDGTGTLKVYTHRGKLSVNEWEASPAVATLFDYRLPVAGWGWGQRVVLMYPVMPDVIAVYVSEDDCATWRLTVWSSDCGATWRTGDWTS